MGQAALRNVKAPPQARTVVPPVRTTVRRKGGTKITKTSLVPFVPFRGSSAIVPPTITIGRSAQEVLGSHRLQKFDARTITTSTGAPLPVAIKNPLSRSFSIDLTPIRVHTDAHAQLTVRKLNTRAFTYANHIFLGPGESPRDLRLMAHEVAHVVQQSRGAVLQHFTTTHADVFEHEAERASAAVMRGEKFNVQQRAHPRPQGLFGLSLPNPLTWLANRVNSIPGFRMLTIILGMNPVNGEAVPRTAANILRALVEFIPGGTLITQALDNYGIFDRVGAFVEEQINSLAMTAGAIGNAVTEFISSLSPSDILNLGGVWDRAVRIFTTPIDRIISLGRRLVTRIVQFIKDAILQPLAQLASQTRGWDLLIAVLGRNPITGEAVPRNAETLIGGFMRLIGQEEVWTNLQRARAVPRAWAWFQGALSGLLNFVSQIPTLFMQALRSLELVDIVVLPRAFVRVGSVFGNFVVQFISWAGQQVFSLLQIIFEVLAPLAMPYIRRATSALRTIFSDPVGFVGNLVRAGIQGFRQFGSNFLTHLRTSLIGWLTGTLSGANIYIPQAFNLREIIKFVLSVLGLTWQNIRTKLVRAIGETATSALETGFEIVTTLITEGPAAAWEQIREGISNLREMVMEQIMTFVRDRIVVAAITRLVTSLNPAGAFIQAVIATYNTIMFFVERLRQIMQVVMAFIDSMAAIASGNITAAANRVEQTMAGMLTLVISFLARLVGLGRVSDAVRNIINRIRAPIDRALDRVVAWIVRQARRLGRAIAEAGLPRDPQQRLRMGLNAAVSAIRRLPGNQVGRALLNPILSAVRTRYGFTSLEPQIRNGRWWIQGTINPTGGQDGEKEAATGPPRVDANVNQDFLVKRVTFLHARVLRKDDATQQLELKHVYDDRRVTLTYDEFNTEIAQPRSVVVRAFDAVRWGNSRYKELAADDRILIESGREFSGTQKANIRDKNRQLNGGQLLSDQSRTPLVDPVRAVSRGMAARTGTTYTGVPPNQAQVDHVHPKDGGGYNSYANAEVLSERENQAKRNR